MDYGDGDRSTEYTKPRLIGLHQSAQLRHDAITVLALDHVLLCFYLDSG